MGNDGGCDKSSFSTSKLRWTLGSPRESGVRFLTTVSFHRKFSSNLDHFVLTDNFRAGLPGLVMEGRLGQYHDDHQSAGAKTTR